MAFIYSFPSLLLASLLLHGGLGWWLHVRSKTETTPPKIALQLGVASKRSQASPASQAKPKEQSVPPERAEMLPEPRVKPEELPLPRLQPAVVKAIEVKKVELPPKVAARQPVQERPKAEILKIVPREVVKELPKPEVVKKAPKELAKETIEVLPREIVKELPKKEIVKEVPKIVAKVPKVVKETPKKIEPEPLLVFPKELPKQPEVKIATAPSLPSVNSVDAIGAKVDQEPKMTNLNITPMYPSFELANRIEGNVFVRIKIDEQGKVDVILIQSSGNSALDNAALQSLRTWRFEPARRDGKPVPFEYPRHEIKFYISR